MFSADPRITYVPAQREQVVAVHCSLNKPAIAVPGKAAQEVQAFVVGAGLGGGTYTVFVYLYLTQSHEAVVYLDPERLRVEPSAYQDMEGEALGFVESMGFMMETLNFPNLAPAQQVELMGSLPCFQKELKAAGPAAPGKGGERPDSPQVRLARLFAAF